MAVAAVKVAAPQAAEVAAAPARALAAGVAVRARGER